MRVAIGYRARQRVKVFLMFQQHREQHHLKRHITSQVGAGSRVSASGGKQFV
jgi:hypothetical protein